MNGIDISGYVSKQIESRFAESGRRIRTTAQTLRTVAQELRDDPTTSAGADFAERGADFIDRVGSYFEETDLETMMGDAEAFSLRQPLIVAAAGITAGILASRLLKATASRRSRLSEPSAYYTNVPAAGAYGAPEYGT